jgi:hypothetical protein
MKIFTTFKTTKPPFTLKKMIARKVCTACSRISYRIVPLTNLPKYLHSGTSETEVNINRSVNNGSDKFLKKNNTSTFGQQIIAVCASVVCIYISVHVC